MVCLVSVSEWYARRRISATFPSDRRGRRASQAYARPAPRREDCAMSASKGLSTRTAIVVLASIMLFGALVRLLLVSLPADCPVDFWGGDDLLLCNDLEVGSFELDR